MSTVFLHIGTPKTGTTAIQIFLRKNRNQLKEKGCIAPIFNYKFTNVRPQRNGHFLSPSVKDQEIKTACFNRLFKVAKDFEKVILTDEGLWNLSEHTESFWLSLKEKLDENNINLKVVVYLRRQDSYFTSHWAQKVKGVRNATYTFHEFLSNQAGKDIVLDYFSQINLIKNIIGKENIIIRPYEFSQFKNNSIIEDFMEAVDVELDDTFTIDNSFRNISINGNLLEVKRYLNKVPEFLKYNTDIQPLLIEIQEQLNKNGLYRNCSTFLRKQRKEFMEKYKEGNEILAREYLNRKDGILFYSPLPTDDPAKNNYSIKELNAILDLIVEKNKNTPDSNIPDDIFVNIAEKAKKIIFNEKSYKYKIKKLLDPTKNKGKQLLRRAKGKIKTIIKK